VQDKTEERGVRRAENKNEDGGVKMEERKRRTEGGGLRDGELRTSFLIPRSSFFALCALAGPRP
jgi:hypothetical protein